MRTCSLRFRLTIWYAAVLAAGLGLFGSLVWLICCSTPPLLGHASSVYYIDEFSRRHSGAGVTAAVILSRFAAGVVGFVGIGFSFSGVRLAQAPLLACCTDT